MENINLEKIGFGSYIKINFIGSFTLGLVLGMIGFVISIISPDSVYLTLGEETTAGIVAGLSGIILWPILISIMFALFSIFLYLGVLIYLKIRKGINIKVKVKNE